MNKIILVIILIILIGGIVGAVIYFNKGETKPSQETPPTTQETPPPVINKVDAVCRGEIKDEYYIFDTESKLGSDILKSLKEKFSFTKNFIKHFLIKEKYALSSGTSSDPTTLDLSKYYKIGRLNTSSTVSAPINGGINTCPIYPNIVYKMI